jgi:hypothetical protein
MQRRGLVLPGPRPAQQFWAMYVPSILAVLPFVPELSVLFRLDKLFQERSDTPIAFWFSALSASVEVT